MMMDIEIFRVFSIPRQRFNKFCAIFHTFSIYRFRSFQILDGVNFSKLIENNFGFIFIRRPPSYGWTAFNRNKNILKISRNSEFFCRRTKIKVADDECMHIPHIISLLYSRIFVGRYAIFFFS